MRRSHLLLGAVHLFSLVISDLATWYHTKRKIMGTTKLITSGT